MPKKHDATVQYHRTSKLKPGDKFSPDMFQVVYNQSANGLLLPRRWLKAFNGDHATVLFLARVLYLGIIEGHPEFWVPRTYREWSDDIFLSEYQVRRIIIRMSGLLIVDFKVQKVNGVPVGHCRVNLDELEKYVNVQVSGVRED